MCHFRSVHRGSSFQDLRTTASRKLLPESWGFLCPVHTPDGGPCGLLNHLATPCEIVTRAENASELPALLSALGMLPHRCVVTFFPAYHGSAIGNNSHEYMNVILNGKVLGKVLLTNAQMMANKLEIMKIRNSTTFNCQNLHLQCLICQLPQKLR